jgi:hypothetical protein
MGLEIPQGFIDMFIQNGGDGHPRHKVSSVLGHQPLE